MLNTAWIFAWDLQFIERTVITQSFFLWFALCLQVDHMQCIVNVQQSALPFPLTWVGANQQKKSLKPFLFEWTEGPMQNLWQLWAKRKRKENSLKFNTRRLCSQPQLAKSGTNKARPFKCPTLHWKKEILFLWAHPHTTHSKWRYRESTCQYSNSENLFRGFAISILAHELTVLLKWSR